MAHHVYNTRGIVLASRPIGEADRLLSVFTLDVGLVRTTARGIRRERSKLRGILLDLASVHISLVKGKQMWRTTTAALVCDNAGLLRKRKGAQQSLSRVAALLERLVHGEEKHVDLFESLERDVAEIVEKDLTPEEVEGWEIRVVAQILYHLGYLAKEHVPSTIEEALAQKRSLVSVINIGIRETGL